jgi:hypothetical protein
LLKFVVNAGPARRLGCPYSDSGLRDLGVIESSSSNEDEMGPSFRLAEQLRATGHAEPPMHHVAAVGDATVITCHPVDSERRRGEADVDRPATSSEILANAAPANAGDNWI